MPTALVTAAAAVAVAVLFNALNPAPVGQPDVATRHHEGSADDAERAACSKVHAVIIGAGPAGLAVAARLMNLGVPFVVLEKSLDAGTSWRGRYDRLHLHTHKDISSLPFWPFPAHFPTYISKDDLADYYAGFAKLLGHHLQLGVEVTSARRVDNQWEVRAADGRRWRAGAIVLCTGQEGTPRVPELDGASSFAGQLMHSSRYVNGAAYRGKRVLVVGAGNSGGEITLDLWEHGAANVHDKIQGSNSARHSPRLHRCTLLTVACALCVVQVTMLARSPVHVLPRWLANMPFLGSRPFALQRYHTPLWLSDLLNRHVVMPLLFADLESHGLRLKWDDGIKTHIFKHHSPPLLVRPCLPRQGPSLHALSGRSRLRTNFHALNDDLRFVRSYRRTLAPSTSSGAARSRWSRRPSRPSPPTARPSPTARGRRLT